MRAKRRASGVYEMEERKLHKVTELVDASDIYPPEVLAMEGLVPPDASLVVSRLREIGKIDPPLRWERAVTTWAGFNNGIPVQVKLELEYYDYD